MIIYRANNKINSKIYIGQTARSLKHRIKEHLRDKGVYFNDAFRKYGPENFDFEIMAYCDSKEKLNFLENLYIKFCNSKPPTGYNLTDGGGGILGYKYRDDVCRKMSNYRKGKKNPNWGKHHTLETIKKISEAKKGKMIGEKSFWFGKIGEKHSRWGKQHTQKSREKMSLAQKNRTWGKTMSEETRIKLSKANSGNKNPMFGRRGGEHPMFGKKRLDVAARNKLYTGENHPMWGKHHSKETKKKMSETHKAKVPTDKAIEILKLLGY